MTRPFHIPMSPEELPQQRIVEVVDLPILPEGVRIITDDREMPDEYRNGRSPAHTSDLCALEWAWSPMNNRLQGYSLEWHARGNSWILWSYFADFEENDYPPWVLSAVCPHPEIDQRTAAVHLVIASLLRGRETEGLDHFHWIADTGFLSAADLKAIGRVVWPKKS